MLNINDASDPWRALALALLQRAAGDARRGDAGALAWLVADGAAMAARVHPDGDDLVYRFARRALAEMDAGRVRRVWRV